MAAPTPDPGTIIYLKDWLTLAALVLGPIISVWWTLHHQDRVEKRTAKYRLFITLMSHRKSQPNAEWATALNLIDVVYEDHPNIVKSWHDMYDMAGQGQAGSDRWIRAYLTLLSDMANVLGYKRLKQTDIDMFYNPQAAADLNQRIYEVQTELLRVLKKSRSFSEEIP